MRLDLREYLTIETIYAHFELFMVAYEFSERFGESDEHWQEELEWFDENAPYFLPVIDRWVTNHIAKRRL